MFWPRIIPVLLLKGQGLVKTEKFKINKYIGDPINAVKIFNDLRADELIFLDIMATKENRTISVDFIKKVGEEANMPFAAGGGINSINQIRDIIAAGAEKVVINTYAGINPKFISKAAQTFGSTTIIICVDVSSNLFRKQKVCIERGKRTLLYKVSEYIKLIEDYGAGEIIIQSIDNDGMMNGYDLDLIRMVSDSVTIPVIALGGAGNMVDFKKAIVETGCSAVAAGSVFVYHGERKGVLINYPNTEEKRSIRGVL